MRCRAKYSSSSAAIAMPDRITARHIIGITVRACLFDVECQVPETSSVHRNIFERAVQIEYWNAASHLVASIRK